MSKQLKKWSVADNQGTSLLYYNKTKNLRYFIPGKKYSLKDIASTFFLNNKGKKLKIRVLKKLIKKITTVTWWSCNNCALKLFNIKKCRWYAIYPNGINLFCCTECYLDQMSLSNAQNKKI